MVVSFFLVLHLWFSIETGLSLVTIHYLQTRWNKSQIHNGHLLKGWDYNVNNKQTINPAESDTILSPPLILRSKNVLTGLWSPPDTVYTGYHALTLESFLCLYFGLGRGWFGGAFYVLFSMCCISLFWPGMVLNQGQLSIVVSDWEPYLSSLFPPVFCG